MKIDLPDGVSEQPPPGKRRTKASEVRKARAQSFANALQDGATPTEAAQAVHAPLGLLERDPEVQKKLIKLKKDYELSADERRRLARNRLNQIALEGDNRDAINAIKVIVEDPEVNIGSQVPLVAQQFNFTPEMENFLRDSDATWPPEQPSIAEAEVKADDANGK